jgi:hypothetical protein
LVAGFSFNMYCPIDANGQYEHAAL